MTMEGIHERKTPEVCRGCIFDEDCSHQKKGILCHRAETVKRERRFAQDLRSR